MERNHGQPLNSRRHGVPSGPRVRRRRLWAHSSSRALLFTATYTVLLYLADAAMLEASDATMHGFLVKRGLRVKTWRRRYFSFEDGMLAYSKSDRPGAKIIREDHVDNVLYWSGRKHGFCVHLRSGRALYLSARSEDEATEWYNVVYAHLQRQQLAREFRRLLTRRHLAPIKESYRETNYTEDA